MKFISNFFASIFLMICCFSFAQASQCQGSIIKTDDKLGFSGCISEKIADLFIAATLKNPSIIVFQSTGGDVSAAIRMAKAINKIQAILIIRGICFSSCANYIIPAAREVKVEDDAIIGYHGDARITLKSNSLDINPKEFLKFSKILEQEKKFTDDFSRAELTHALQAIALSMENNHVQVKIKKKYIYCRGQGNKPWIPSLQLLRDLNIIDEVIIYSNENIPELVKFNLKNFNHMTPSDKNPLSDCKEK